MNAVTSPTSSLKCSHCKFTAWLVTMTAFTLLGLFGGSKTKRKVFEPTKFLLRKIADLGEAVEVGLKKKVKFFYLSDH